ncbi:flavodoxin [Peptacetobacter sp.]|uniref:flavodoxin n=1 Tax=Peptacetobacter sp. TaxID=2991975 RepID=UPI002607D801|nr:flavodoxin [Peptacetobacter sp.]
MKEIKVVYWSGTGNTESMANMLSEAIKASGNEATLFNVSDIDKDKLLEDEIFVLGCPSMGNEELEEGEMEPFVESLEGGLSGKKVALFGSYGWGSGEWMETWSERMTNAGAEVIGTVICNEAPSGDTEAELKELASKF